MASVYTKSIKENATSSTTKMGLLADIVLVSLSALIALISFVVVKSGHVTLVVEPSGMTALNDWIVSIVVALIYFVGAMFTIKGLRKVLTNIISSVALLGGIGIAIVVSNLSNYHYGFVVFSIFLFLAGMLKNTKYKTYIESED